VARKVGIYVFAGIDMALQFVAREPPV